MLLLSMRIAHSWQGEKCFHPGLVWHPSASELLCKGQLAAAHLPMIIHKTRYYLELIYNAKWGNRAELSLEI